MKKTLVIIFTLIGGFSYTQNYLEPSFTGQVMELISNTQGNVLEQQVGERKNPNLLVINEAFSYRRILSAKPKFIIKVNNNSLPFEQVVTFYIASNSRKTRQIDLDIEMKLDVKVSEYKDQFYIIEFNEELEEGTEYIIKVKDAFAVSCFGLGREVKTKNVLENVSSSFRKRSNLFYAGFKIGKNKNLTQTTYKGLGLYAEIPLTDFLGFAPNISVYSTKKDFSNFFTPKSTFISGGSDINFHLLSVIGNKKKIDISQDKMDLYVGAGIQFGVDLRKQNFPGQDSTTAKFNVGWGVHTGLRYYPIPQLGIYTELGISKNIFSLGLVYNMNRSNSIQNKNEELLNSKDLVDPIEVMESEIIELKVCEQCEGAGQVIQERNVICSNNCVKGQLTCSGCSGTGNGQSKGNKFNPETKKIETVYETCNMCDGLGKHKCSVCTGNGIELKKSKLSCTKCSGKGKL